MKKTTKPNANIVGANAFARDHRGITLIALIITIIVMLILVAVSVTIAINGGLFGITKKAAKDTEKAKNAEQELANGRIKIDNTWYDSFEDYVGGKPSEDQNESNIKFAYEPKGWTKGPVKVKIESKEDKGQLQYSMDGVTWENYTEEIEVENNGTKIYAREVNDIEEEVEIGIDKIDKEAPSITTALNSPGQTISSINLEVGVTDSISGISKIEWYYKKQEETNYTTLTDDYVEMNGEKAGEKAAVTKTKELPELTKETTYNIYAIVYDVAGNSTRSPETGTIDIETMGSLVGRSATINGQKYIVMYEPGEKIEIDGKEYEIENPQLISANVLRPGEVCIGCKDEDIDWNSISWGQSDFKKGQYCWMYLTEILDKKCVDTLGDLSLPALSIRCPGTPPVPYTYDAIRPTKLSYEDYLTPFASDSAKVEELRLKSIFGSGSGNGSQSAFWFAFSTASWTYNSSNYKYYFNYYAGYFDSSLKSTSLWSTGGLGDRGYSGYLGLRPIITISKEDLPIYLD